ncbi:MAG: putative flagellar associated protein, partial [Streblomastix strix]
RGDLCIYDRGELHLTLTSVLGQGISITTLVGLKKNGGFIVGGENGKFSIFENSADQAEVYRIRHALQIPRDQKITALSVSPNNQQLAAVIGHAHICIVNLGILETVAEKDMENTIYNFVSGGFHFGAITGLSIAQRKPIAATCGVDQWVRIWNFLDMSCELAVHFDSETRSISLHPSGFHAILSCGDRVKLLNIMPHTLDVLREFPFPQQSGCQEVLFSRGGHLFACAHAKTISIFNTYTGECIGMMRGHIGPVRSIAFGPNDKCFYSA